MAQAKVSKSTLQRLPVYYRCLKKHAQAGREYISCPHIADELKLDPTQVRKDISVTGVVGKTRIGFFIPDTLLAIRKFLGWDNISEAFLIGAGHLGNALLGYTGFENSGMKIIAAFDSDTNKIGREIHGHTIMDIQKLDELIPRMNVRIAILAIPPQYAQQTAERLVRSGIRAIWNFTPVWLTLRADVIVENVDLASSLAVLSGKLQQIFDKESE